MESQIVTRTIAIEIVIPIGEAEKLYWDLDKVFTNRLPMPPIDKENRNMTVPTLQKFYDILFEELEGEFSALQEMSEHN